MSYERVAVGAGASGLEQAQNAWFFKQQRTNELFERANATGFDVSAYAETRKTAADWLTVDIGPGIRPNGLNRPFTGKSAYIAIEAQQNESNRFSRYTPEYFKGLWANRPEENIFLIIDKKIGRQIDPNSEQGKVLNAAMRPEVTEEAVIAQAQQIKDDQTKYLLPANVADEIFVVYTLDDPMSNTGIIIGEAARMLKPGGTLIMYDTYSNAATIADELEAVGLEPVYARMEPAASQYDDFIDDERTLFRDVAAPLGCYQTNKAPHFEATEDLVRPDMLLIASKPS